LAGERFVRSPVPLRVPYHPNVPALLRACQAAFAAYPHDSVRAFRHLAETLGYKLPAGGVAALQPHFDNPMSGWMPVSPLVGQRMADLGWLVVDLRRNQFVVLSPGGPMQKVRLAWGNSHVGIPTLTRLVSKHPRVFYHLGLALQDLADTGQGPWRAPTWVQPKSRAVASAVSD
jgi:hypothetical protein